MKQRGLTLIELLVAMFIMAVLAVLSYRTISAMIDASRHVDGAGRRFDRLVDSVDLIDRDLTFLLDAQSSGLAVRGDGGAAGRPGEIRFPMTSSAYRAGKDAAPVVVGYRLDGGKLEKLVYPQPWMLNTQPDVRVLLTGRVKDLRFRFRDRAGIWHGQWPVQTVTGVPAAVEYQLTLADGSKITRLVAIP